MTTTLGAPCISIGVLYEGAKISVSVTAGNLYQLKTPCFSFDISD